MQLNATKISAGTREVLASQTIDIRSTSLPTGGMTVTATEREYRLAGAREGIDTFTSFTDALQAARALSRGSMPGLAIMEFRGGYRVHDVHAASRTYLSNSPHGHFPPMTRELGRSSVPFAGGNLRPTGDALPHSPAVLRSEKLAALVDGTRVFIPDANATWAGRPVLTEMSYRA